MNNLSSNLRDPLVIRSSKGDSNERSDWLSRAVVGAAIELSSRKGVFVSAKFLFTEGVPLEIALRVLAKPKVKII